MTEKLTGQNWEELLEETLFRPLGMTSSTVIDQAFFQKNNIAAPHIFNETTKRLEIQDHSIYRCVIRAITYNVIYILIDTLIACM